MKMKLVSIFVNLPMMAFVTGLFLVLLLNILLFANQMGNAVRLY